MPAFLQTLAFYVSVGVVFVLMISVLVAAHELGHYLFARMFGMGVEEFAVGFGKKPLVTYMKRTYTVPLKPGDDPYAGYGSDGESESGQVVSKGPSLEGGVQDRKIEVIEVEGGQALRETTDFTIRPWPLGGFVRIKGMIPENDGSEVRVPGGFYSKAPWQRFLVLFAGPLFSVLAGVLILIPVMMSQGVSRANNEPILGTVSPNGVAARAGLKEGDRFVSIADKKVTSFYDVITVVRDSAGKELPVTIERAGQTVTLTVTPRLSPAAKPVIGPDMSPTGEVRQQGELEVSPTFTRVELSAGEAVKEAVAIPVKISKSLISMFAKPSQISDNVGGPGTMVSFTGAAVKGGIYDILGLSALLSISVGLFNLLPAPPLDGGQMAVAVVEMLRRGRRLSMKVQNAVSLVGITCVGLLILTALFSDVKRFTKIGQKPAAESSNAATK